MMTNKTHNKTVKIKQHEINSINRTIDKLFSTIDMLAWEVKAERMELGRECYDCPILEDRQVFGVGICDCPSVTVEKLIYE